MKKLKCIIIDDEKKDRENLKILLESYCPNVDIIGEAFDEVSILKTLLTMQADIVFMDIQIGSMAIFDILNQLKEIKFKIVFVTAYDKYAIEGYQYDAIDYLLKPVEAKKLIWVVDKIKKEKEKTEEQHLNNKDLKALYNKVFDAPKISITDAKGIHMIKTSEILYCVSDGNYTTFVLTHNKEIVISKNLKHFEIKLEAYNFLRIHKSYLINLNHIDFLIKEQGGYVNMKNGKSIPISRNSKKELYEKMNLL